MSSILAVLLIRIKIKHKLARFHFWHHHLLQTPLFILFLSAFLADRRDLATAQNKQIPGTDHVPPATDRTVNLGAEDVVPTTARTATIFGQPTTDAGRMVLMFAV